MYLKSLELQGFKSFPDKTKLTFEGGTTVIVGPNGSGKSNLSDAMKWVLGEISSKSIRGTKMEDIIFGGADSRRPMGYAEVSVTFDNTGMLGRLDCPYDEVTVTRRYYRSGESEYYINRRAVRLRDIYELFMNTGIGRDGYSIISQGKIAEIISRKSDERRGIFEDASGIAKYRHKKSETERKLASTEDNMTRINDIFLEVESQVGPLEKEAEKAKRALTLLETKKQVDVQLWLYDTEKLRSDVARCEEQFGEASFELQNIEESLKSLEAQNAKLFEISQSNKSESEQLLRQIGEQTEQNHRLDREYRLTEAEVAHTGELIAGAEGSIASLQKSMESENLSETERAAKLSALQAALSAKEEEGREASFAQTAASKEAEALGFEIDRALGDIRALESERADVKARIEVIENTRHEGVDKDSAMLREIKTYENRAEQQKKECATIQKSVDQYEVGMQKATNAATEATARLADLYSRRHDDNEAMSSLRLKRDAANQRIETFRAMEAQFEGYSGSVRFVMKQYEAGEITDRHGNKCGKIYGPLSRLINVEKAYITAIETALGPNLQHIVVEDEDVAKSAMFALKKAEAGRATFFPLTSMKPQAATDEMRQAVGYPGYIAVADELVTADAKFDKILSGLLGRTLIFDTIDHATEMAKDLRYTVKVVTLDGQQIHPTGSFTGGSARHNGNILGRAGEIKRLEGEVSELETRMNKLEGELKKQNEEISAVEEEKDSAEQQANLIRVMRDSENARLAKLTATLDATEATAQKLRDDYGDSLRIREQYEEDQKRLTVRLSELEIQIGEIGAARANMDVRRNEALDRKEEAAAHVTETIIAVNEIRKDIETEQRLSAESEERRESFLASIGEQEEKISQLRARIASFEEQKQANRAEFAAGEKRLAELTEQRSRVEAGSSEFERKLSEVNAKTREKNNQKDLVYKEYVRFENRLANLRTEQDKLVSRLWDEHELTRADALALGYPALDQSTRAEAAAKQTECRNKLRAIGNVDLDSVNKYKEVKERYDYMKGQIHDLTVARDDLLGIISQLEGEMESSFVESFTQINENFNRVFGELFGGGSAELTLTDPEHVLESGIEIKAAPPGKIIKNMVQLSGGEQSFIAIALFFAILQVNPTPFCILDEIEAALDEVNVARFAEYIKRYAGGTQFVLITHRRGTMEAANRLYGVTMPEHGISKVLELDVGDISKKKGDDWDGIFG